jgi:hypothetical protein
MEATDRDHERVGSGATAPTVPIPRANKGEEL